MKLLTILFTVFFMINSQTSVATNLQNAAFIKISNKIKIYNKFRNNPSYWIKKLKYADDKIFYAKLIKQNKIKKLPEIIIKGSQFIMSADGVKMQFNAEMVEKGLIIVNGVQVNLKEINNLEAFSKHLKNKIPIKNESAVFNFSELIINKSFADANVIYTVIAGIAALIGVGALIITTRNRDKSKKIRTTEKAKKVKDPSSVSSTDTGSSDDSAAEEPSSSDGPFAIGAPEKVGQIDGFHTASDIVSFKGKLVISANSYGGNWRPHGTAIYTSIGKGNPERKYHITAESFGYLTELNGELWIPTEHGGGIYTFNGTNGKKVIGQPAKGWAISGATLNNVYYSGFNGDLAKAGSILYGSNGQKINMPTKNLPWMHVSGKHNMLILGFRGNSFLFDGAKFHNIAQSDQFGAGTYLDGSYYAGSFTHSFGAIGAPGRFVKIDENTGAQTLIESVDASITDMKVINNKVVFSTEKPFIIYAYDGGKLIKLYQGNNSHHNGWGHAFCEHDGYLFFAEGDKSTNSIQIFRAKL